MYKLCVQVPHVLESNPAALVSAEHPGRISTASSDVLDPPKFTYSHTEPPDSLTASKVGKNYFFEHTVPSPITITAHTERIAVAVLYLCFC